MMRSTRNRFGALLSPHGMHVVGYASNGRGFEVTRIASVSGPFTDVEDASQRVAAALREHAPGGGEVSLLVHGLASNYEKLTMPAAAPAVLKSVVQREMLRLSGVADGVVAHMQSDAGTAATPGKQDIWAGVIGTRMRDLLIDHLAAGRITINHITVLPSVLATLYERLGSGPSDGAIMLCLPEGPVTGFFQDGRLRLILESPLGESDTGTYAAVCSEQFTRGEHFLRQQFRGAAPTTLLLAAESRIWSEISVDLRANSAVQVLPLGDPHEPISSLLALGAALDSSAHPEMNLARNGVTKRVRPRGSILRKAVVASQMLVLIATVIAITQLARLSRAESSLERRDEDAWRYYRPLSAMVTTARGRASEQRDIEAFESVLQQNGSLQSVLSALAAAAPPGIVLDSVEVVQRSGIWDGIVVGHTSTGSNAEGVRQLSRFYRNLGEQTAIQRAEVEDFSYPAAQRESSPGLRFKIVFGAGARP